MTSDIAVIGIGCRFPGADNIEEFWRVLVNGENHVTDIPDDRWNNEAFFSENKDEKGKYYARKAAFLTRHDEWDNKFFGLSDYEAAQVDPQQRYVLECTHMAFEDGGLTNEQLKGSETGVFIGCMSEDYKVLFDFDHEHDNSYTITGTNGSIISARVSYVYDLRGPCMVVNTACSSSMTAIHLACQAINSGDCEMAVCGGVGSILAPDIFVPASKAGMMSAAGQCQAFCDTADGYVRGEGCGILILKSFEKAVNDKNRIWGKIRIGVNQDGHVAQPITAPAGEQQEKLLERLYRKYSMDPNDIQYIECHGTGTPVGDPVEVNALGRFRTYFRSKILEDVKDSRNDAEKIENIKEKSPIMNRSSEDITSKILIGSVKTNIGHLEAAAGVAGVIKVLLMMDHGQFVPSLHAKLDKSNWNKRIHFEEYALDISLKVSPWKMNKNGERIGCVNSFGFGGSNSHCIIVQRNSDIGLAEVTHEPKLKLICVSANDNTSLLNSIEALGRDLERTEHSLHDVSFTSIFHRNHYKCRVLLFGEANNDIRSQISKQMAIIEKPEVVQNHNIVFLFSGMGTAWNGMCQELMNTQSIFRETVQNIDTILEKFTGFRMEEKFRKETIYNDPFLDALGIFYVQIGLYHIWKSWGILPNVVLGQSVGEVAAAYTSGALTLKDAARVIYVRSKYISKQTGGKMCVVGNVSESVLKGLCDKYDDKVIIAVVNSPRSFTLSGDADIIEMIMSDLFEIGRKHNQTILIRSLAVRCAYHSRHMDSCLDDIANELKGLEGGAMTCQQISTVFGKIVENNVFINSQYWKDNVRQPVKFMQAVKHCTTEESTNIFIEVGPKPVLRTHMEALFTDQQKNICVPSIREKWENRTLYSSLGKLYQLGVDISWPNLVPPFGRVVPIPRYIFHKSKNLFIPHGHKLLLKAVPKESNAHMYLVTSDNESEDFHITVNQNTTPFIFDHFFFDSCLVPGVTYVEAGFEIGNLKTKFNPYEIEIFAEFIKAMTANSEKPQSISITVNEDSQLLSFSAKNEGKTLCTGRIGKRKTIGKNEIDIAKIKDRCTTHYERNECYASLEKYHFKYGKSLKVIEEAWSSETECLGRIHLPDSVLKESKHTNIHPSALDAMMQTVATMRFKHDDYSVPYLPKMLGSVLLNRPIQQAMYAYSHITRQDEEGYHYNCLLSCPNGQVIAEIHNFHFQKMNTESHSPMNVTFNTVNWRLTKMNIAKDPFSDPSCKTDQVAFLCSKRFAERISLAKRTDTAYVHVLDEECSQSKALLNEWLENPSLNTIVYAPCHHIDERNHLGYEISELAHSSFLTLQYLLQHIVEHHLVLTIFVITESVWSNSKLEKDSKTANVLGSELWGMVRSAMLELPEIDLRLIDLVLSEKNMDTLQSILYFRDSVEKEILLRDGQVFNCKMSECDIEEDEHLKRDIIFDGNDAVVLKSKNPAVIKNPYFELGRFDKDRRLPTDCQMKIQEVFLHEPDFYPATSAFFDTDETIWPEDSEEGFQVICLEGHGFKINRSFDDRKDSKLGFCFPVEVASVVTVPDECTFAIGDISCYHPGMITVGVLLWNVIQHVKSTECSCIVVNDESNLWLQIAKHMLSTINSVCHAVKRCNLLQPAFSNLESVETIIVLSAITHKHIEQIVAKCPKLRCIISTEYFLSIHAKVWLEVHVQGINVVILSMENIFDPASLRLSVVQVCNSLREFKDSCSLDEQPFQHAESVKQMDILKLPFQTLSVSAQNKNNNRISLKVDSASIFRKTGCYIVVGGLTGLGWILVEYLSELGAGFIASFSRRKATREQKEQMALIQAKYCCRIIAMQVNINSIESLEKAVDMLNSQIGSSTIRGVFHGGGILCDKHLKQMSEEDIKGPMLPKILGTWNLHAATLNCPLDFFVMHSSIASVFGSHGQCNYAAGNSFEDAFANYRRQLGLCGQSINWSALSVGMSTTDSRLENYWKSMGFYVLTKEDIRKSFLKMMMGNFEQILCGKFDWIKLGESPMVSTQPGKFSNILEKYAGNIKSAKHSENTFCFDEYVGLDNESQHRIIYDIARSSLSDATVIDKNNLKEDTQFSSLGIDSMSAMSLVNMVFDITQVRVPLENVLTGSSTLKSLTSLIKQKLNSKQPQLASRNKQNDGNILQLTCEEMLRDEVTFLQKFILENLSGENEVHYIYQIECDIHGEEISKEKFQMAAKALCMRHSELRKIYHRNDDQTYRAELLSENQIAVDVKEIKFDSTDFETDNRTNIHFDPAKDVPVKFEIATKNEQTRVIIYLHTLAFDLGSMDPFVRDLRSSLQSEELQETKKITESQESVARLLSKAIFPQTDELLQYWTRQVNQDIQPLTLGPNVNVNLLEKKMCTLSLNVPSAWIEKINAFTRKSGMSIYEYVVSAYFATLHQITKKDIFPLVTRADLRGSVPQLKGYIARCANLIPLVGNFKDIGTVGKYLAKMCVMMREATQYNLCPFSLIIKAVKNEEMRRHIGRHDIGYDNMTNLHKTLAKSKRQIKLKKVFHGGHSVETVLVIEHDTVQNNLKLIFQYESQIVSKDVANMLMERFFYMIRAFLAHEDTEFQHILNKKDDFEALDEPCPKKHSAIKMNKNDAKPGRRSLMRCDTFAEHMTSAKDERIHLQMVQEKFDNGNVDIVLVWRRKDDDSVLQEISVDMISEVVAKEEKDESYILLKTGHRWLIFKTSSREASVDWLHMFKDVVETVRPRLIHDIIFHL